MKRIIIVVSSLAFLVITGLFLYFGLVLPNQEASAARQTESSAVLYVVPEDWLKRPLNEIPYYAAGQIDFNETAWFDRHKKEGSQPWLSRPLDVTRIMCRNLLGNQADLTGGYAHEDELKSQDGTQITLTKDAEKKKEVELFVPRIGRYEITLESPKGTDILFVTQIVFFPK